MPTPNPEHAVGLRRILTRAGIRAALPYVAFALLLLVAVVLVGQELEHHFAAIESWIAGLGPWGPTAFVVLFVVLTSLLVPDTVVCVIAGALFGFAWGVAAVVIASVLAGALQYALARRLLRARIDRALASRPPLAAMQRAVARDQLRLQVLVRLTPLNPATISYLLGAAGVRFPGFLVASLASVPYLVIEVYFGLAGRHVAGAATGAAPTSRLHVIVLIGGAVVSIVVMVVVSKLARRALLHEVARCGDAGG